jgi:hypothetical protein
LGKKKKKKKAERAPFPRSETPVNRLGVVITILLILGLVAAVVYVARIPSHP